ncbi:hypothetical protein SmphiM12_336 [Sinorhizobium phage phiM12]|uniref:Uncharacterized protein n=1 Tax=Sinorhizobium phage phiM12 TaxID=1357423 RepID=S5MBI2_9CAUD|nr:hypothetical protein AB690_gp256 [Sinorhizobium phage phiM12]AGR47968.1 hypothetical protein SmphiM12_336 [Sinorhizobium phage phiM12]AKF13159.1 hypothetical protein PHIM19_254 [Sinorhizobium phage phiM19]
MRDPNTPLNEVCEKAKNDYLERRSMLFIESAIGCLLDTKTPAEAAGVLREFADQLESFG